MSEFDSYYQNIEEPDKRQKYNNWSISKGLQQVDGLSTSPYLDKLASDNIEGLIPSISYEGARKEVIKRRKEGMEEPSAKKKSNRRSRGKTS